MNIVVYFHQTVPGSLTTKRDVFRCSHPGQALHYIKTSRFKGLGPWPWFWCVDDGASLRFFDSDGTPKVA